MLKFRSMRPGSTSGETDDLVRPAAGGFGRDEADATRVGSVACAGHVARRAAAVVQRAEGRHVARRPSPRAPRFVELFEQQIYRYGDRHRVKAGITGWAQINGLRGQTSLADRVEWDNYYIENFSLWLDLKIVGWTIRSLPRHPKVDR